MSTSIEDARQRLVDERLPELEELINHRNECLREMWGYMVYGKDSDDDLALDEEDTTTGGLDGFLERFDLVKNHQTGSILNLEIPELKLRTESSSSTPASTGEAEQLEGAPELEQDEEEHGGTEEEDFMYPDSSPLTARTLRRKVVNEEDEDIGSDGMDEGMADKEDEKPSEPVLLEQEEEQTVDVEDEAGVSEKEVVLRTPTRTRSSSPVAPRRRKRRRSQLSDEDEIYDDIKRPLSIAVEDRHTRSKSRKINSPPTTSPIPDEDDERDELDIISLPSSSNIVPFGKPASKRTDLLRQAVSESMAAHEDTGGDEQIDVLEGEDEADDEERPQEPSDPVEPQNESRFVPASPSTPSAHSLSKSLSKSPIPEPRPPPRSPPRRVTKPSPFYLQDTTPLTPPKSPPPPIIVQLPLSQVEQPVYRFDDGSTTQLNGEASIKYEDANAQTAGSSRPTSSTGTKQSNRSEMNYTLPPLSALPAEFSRKGKPQKSRKRDKEREKGSSDSGKKDDWVPLGMTKWAAILQANPAYKKLSRASKCVSTKDWNTATTELKLIRAFDRINTLKSTGKWSFRQLKKQRVTAGLVKAHWDYLMDEMKWLQVDFREERRWKIALAYELILSVREWHEAGSHEERIRLGICAAWRKPDILEELPTDESNGMEVDIIPPPGPEDEESDDEPPPEKQHVKKSLVNFDSSENEDDMEDQQAVDDALIPDNINTDPLEESKQPFSVPDVVEMPSITMKLEEVEGDDALHLGDDRDDEERILNFRSLPLSTDTQWHDSTKAEAVDPSQALKKTSINPIVDTQPGASTSGPEPIQKEQRSLWTADQAKVIRSSIPSLPEEALFVNLDELVPISDEDLMKSLVPEGDSVDVSSAFDMSTVFPELQPFSLIDVANSDIVGGGFDGKKKGDRKADKDDPTKRTEETTYMKLCPTNRFMHVKPTLVSALQPSKKWRKGKWVDLDESPVVSDVDGPTVAENTCSLFEGRKISIPFLPPLTLQNFSKIPRSNVRPAEIPWSQAEENAMKMLTDRYPSNWRLVADALNSSRIRTSIDLRTPQECFEKWRSKYSLPTRLMLPPGVPPATPFIGYEESSISNHIGTDTPPPQTPSMPTTTPQMTTRGVKRLATSAAQNALNLTVNTGMATVEARKRKRHFIIYDAVRKTMTKRQKLRKQDEAKNQTSTTALAPVHDTHVQYGSTKRHTPLELSIMKTEKEKKDSELMRMRNREMELKRLEQARQYQAQMQQAQQQQQQQQQMSQQGVAGTQNVPQIRTQVGISQHQQQKLPTQVGSIPLSPQMMQQAQAQQARALAQAQAQSQAQQQQQTQPNHPQMQGQMGNIQASMNGTAVHHSTPYANHGGATSPVAQHSSPPRSSATPVNSMANFPRPSSAQRNVSMTGGQVMPMANGQVPIARTNNALAAYFANNGNVQYSPEQMGQLLRYQQAQQAQQSMQLQMQQQQQQQQQQQSMQVPVQQSQQNLGINGYPPTMQ